MSASAEARFGIFSLQPKRERQSLFKKVAQGVCHGWEIQDRRVGMRSRLSSVLAQISQRYRPVVVLVIMVGLGLLAFVVDRVLLGFEIDRDLHSAVQAAIVGLGGAAAVWFILKSYETQRRMEREEIRKVAELNHTLRNSLETIADAHYFVADEEHKKMILETVKNMDEKLRQLFPVKVRATKPLP
jgi:hypothetical protein